VVTEALPRAIGALHEALVYPTERF
jgi:hypothetical protein